MPVARYASDHLERILHDKTELLDVWEVAELTNSHERTVRRWIASGKLAALQKTARGFLIPKQALIDFLTGEKPSGSEAA